MGPVKHRPSDQRLRQTVNTLTLNSGSFGGIDHQIVFIYFLWWISGSPSCPLSVYVIWILLPNAFLAFPSLQRPSPSPPHLSHPQTVKSQLTGDSSCSTITNPWIHNTASTKCYRWHSRQPYCFKNHESRMCRGLFRKKDECERVIYFLFLILKWYEASKISQAPEDPEQPGEAGFKWQH